MAGRYTLCCEGDRKLHRMKSEYPQLEQDTKLVYLILECLLIEPDARPTAKELARRTREGLNDERKYRKEKRIFENKEKARKEREERKARGEDADSVMTDVDLDDFSPGPPYEEPLLSAKWYNEEPQVQPLWRIQPSVPKTAQQASRLRKEQYRKLQIQERNAQAERQVEALQQKEALNARRRIEEPYNPYNQQPLPPEPPMRQTITKKGNLQARPQQGGPAKIPNIPIHRGGRTQPGVPGQVKGPSGFEEQPVYGGRNPPKPPAPINIQNPPRRPQPGALSPSPRPPRLQTPYQNPPRLRLGRPGNLNPNPAIINITPPPQNTMNE